MATREGVVSIRITKNTEGNLQPVKVSDCVTVFVSEINMVGENSLNIIGVVLDVKNDRYKIGTKQGFFYKFLKKKRI